MSVQITEKDFKEYVVVQQSGKYNMFDPKARKKTNLSKDQWEKIFIDLTRNGDQELDMVNLKKKELNI